MVLPAPLGPTRAIRRPGSSCRSTFSSTGRSPLPYRAVTPSRATDAGRDGAATGTAESRTPGSQSVSSSTRRPAASVAESSRAADGSGQHWSPSTTEVAAHLAPAEVWRTKEFDGGYVRNHAKVLAIDHHLLLVTSANLSWSAENNNVEFGILIDNPNLTEAVERELREAEGALYERV